MLPDLKLYKGQHPGLVLNKILSEKGIRKRHLAMTIDEFPQTISNITRGTRGMNTSLSIKLEEALELEEGFFMTLQVHYDIKLVREKQSIAQGQFLPLAVAVKSSIQGSM